MKKEERRTYRAQLGLDKCKFVTLDSYCTCPGLIAYVKHIIIEDKQGMYFSDSVEAQLFSIGGISVFLY